MTEQYGSRLGENRYGRQQETLTEIAERYQWLKGRLETATDKINQAQQAFLAGDYEDAANYLDEAEEEK